MLSADDAGGTDRLGEASIDELAQRAGVSRVSVGNEVRKLAGLGIVTVTKDGFEWQGRPYESLSAIARAITGTLWNGWTFFGLKNHRART